MRIVLVTSEMIPFAKTGGLADVCGALPLELERLGHDVSVIMPGYRGIGPVDPFSARAKTTTIGQNIKVYFIWHPGFYDRPGLYGNAAGDHPDNIERFAFFCHETFRLLKELGKPVDIIHCHDWQTGLIPVLLKENYGKDPFFARTRSIFTIHNLAYQGVFPAADMPKLGVDEKLFAPKVLEFYSRINLLKGALVYADQITTVSPQYAKEIQTREWGCGLDGVIRENRARLTGILNGLDYTLWDPSMDMLLEPRYTDSNIELKAVHKERLQHVFHLPVFDDIPMIGFVGRLCHQKGMDLIENAFEDLMQRPVQIVFIGVGEDKYQKMLLRLAKQYPQQCGVAIRYDEDLAHVVYAGSDLFLMPSVYEPCGLSQMISLRYGSIPVATAVGGLVDTLSDVTAGKGRGNSFVMPTYSVSGLLETVDRALGVFHQKDKFKALLMQAMAFRWTWETSAKHYVDRYAQALATEREPS